MTLRTHQRGTDHIQELQDGGRWDGPPRQAPPTPLRINVSVILSALVMLLLALAVVVGVVML